MKNKILCLHGYAMNRDWFGQWLQPVEQALQSKAEFVYAQGPIACPAYEVRAMVKQFQFNMPAARIGDGLNWCWYRATTDKPPRYLGLDETLQWLHELDEREGPFDAVFGWSQGAVMAAIMAAQQQNGVGHDVSLKWLVLCGGFLPGDPEIKALFEPIIQLPSLHVVGKLESEFMHQRGKKLHACFDQADWLETPVGHMLPLKYPDYMSRIIEWMTEQLDDSDQLE